MPGGEGELREMELLERIFLANSALTARHPHVVVPPGDDMALLRLSAGLDGAALLVAVDSVVEGRHYRRGTPIERVGRKAVNRNLSDVAAMAARPLACLAAVVLPRSMPRDEADRLHEAVRAAGESGDCPLIGGDVSMHQAADGPLVCTVTVLACPWDGDGRTITRSGARVGDRVYVTGVLGRTVNADGFGHHLDFEPRIDAARALLEILGERLHAMIDVSDGLGRDAGHIATRSDVCLRLDAAALPRRNGAGWQEAMSDGEDYELLFTATGEVPASVAGIPVTCIGEVCAAGAGPRVAVEVEGVTIDGGALGWEHRGDGARSEDLP